MLPATGTSLAPGLPRDSWLLSWGYRQRHQTDLGKPEHCLGRRGVLRGEPWFGSTGHTTSLFGDFSLMPERDLVPRVRDGPLRGAVNLLFLPCNLTPLGSGDGPSKWFQILLDTALFSEVTGAACLRKGAGHGVSRGSTCIGTGGSPVPAGSSFTGRRAS